MASRRWDAPWEHFPASTPLKADGGITTSRQRGKMADTWWSKRFVDVLESYGLGTRMQRGRRYARSGQVLSVEVNPGLLVSQVQGSRRTPYVVTIQAPQPTAAQWTKLDDAFRSRVGFAARLLAGEVPPELEDAFTAAGVKLFPGKWQELQATCSCPDWENPCKHIAAALYVYADQLDSDPWLLLCWRGRTREQILGHLNSLAGSDEDRQGLPPWWPLAPGRPTRRIGRLEGLESLTAEPAEPADRVLARLESLEVDIAGTPVVELLGPAYEAIGGAEAPST